MENQSGQPQAHSHTHTRTHTHTHTHTHTRTHTHNLILGQHEIVGAERDAKDDGGNALETMNPLRKEQESNM